MGSSRTVREREVPFARMVDGGAPPAEADPRGWGLLSADGIWMGQVRSVFISPESRARFLDCELDADVLDLSDDRRVLVPADEAGLDASARLAIAQRLTRDDLLRLPHLPAEPPAPVERPEPLPARLRKARKHDPFDAPGGGRVAPDLRGRGSGDI